MLNNKIIITGGSGFIGINLIEELLEKNFEVLNIDVKPPTKLSHIKHYQHSDINNYELFYQKVLDFKPQFVIHLAARTDLNGTNIASYKTNILGTQNLIACLNNIPSIKKVIYTSTMLVCKAGHQPDSETDYCPDTVYGESKVLMEQLIREAKHNYADWVIIRPTSIWGPWFSKPYRDFFDMVKKNIFLDIGIKSATKTYGYVENSTFQIIEILLSNKTSGSTYYIGDYEPIFISDWADEITKLINGKKLPKLPFYFFKYTAKIGDIITYFGINFPLTSFRLKNMTTNNIINLDNTRKIAGELPFTRLEGTKKTLNWLNLNFKL